MGAEVSRPRCAPVPPARGMKILVEVDQQFLEEAEAWIPESRS